MPKLKADVVVVSNMENDACNNIDRLQGEPFRITAPGEFEVKGMHIRGVEYGENDTFYMLKAEGMTLAHLGTTGMPFSDEHLSLLEGVDVVFLPLNCTEGVVPSKMVATIEPRVVVPIMYKAAKEKLKLPEFDAFAKDMGLKNVEPEEKLLLKLKDLPQEETSIRVLSVA